MAHFAELDSNNKVLRVIVLNNQVICDENNFEQENLGIIFCKNLFNGGIWIQTSYNSNFRGKFAGIGDYYDSDKDIFVIANE